MQKKYKNYKEILLLTAIAIPLGVVIGAIDTLFGRILLLIGDVRTAHILYLLPFLAVAGMGIVYCYQRFGGTSSQGMGLIFKVGHGEADEIPLRLVPFVMVGTWLTHLFGGSAGREGVAVQIGGTVAHWLGKRLPTPNAARILLITGMAAGFAGLFRTPLAAVAFGLEVLTVGELALDALLPALTASLTATSVSAQLGLEKFTFAVEELPELSAVCMVKLSILGVLFGLVGCAFAMLLRESKKFFATRLPNPLQRVLIMGVALTVVLLALHMGRYSGLGTNLIHASFHRETIYSYDWSLKLVLTCLTLAAGYQGGEVTPLFSIGASLGVVLASILGLPIAFTAALGYAAVFGSASNTLLAPIFIGAEVFGWQSLPYFFVVCVVAYVCNGNQSIYAQKQKS